MLQKVLIIHLVKGLAPPMSTDVHLIYVRNVGRLATREQMSPLHNSVLDRRVTDLQNRVHVL